MKILVFGLPEAGKTTFAKRLIKGTDFAHFNADEVRGMFNDWDFSEEGRRRQAQRMLALCTMANKTSVVDFICPFDIFRHPYDIKIWINTIDQSHYKDTNKMFQKPDSVDFEINTRNDYSFDLVIKEIHDRLQ